MANGKKVNYNSQISLKLSTPPGPWTLPPTTSMASPGLLIHTKGSGTDGGKHIKLFCSPKYPFLCICARSPQDSGVLHNNLKCLPLKNMVGSKCCQVLVSSLDSACIVFVDLHNCMEMKNFIFGYCNCNQCQSNSF